MSEVRSRSRNGTFLPQLRDSAGGCRCSDTGWERLSFLRGGGSSGSEVLRQLRGAVGSGCYFSISCGGNDDLRQLRRRG